MKTTYKSKSFLLTVLLYLTIIISSFWTNASYVYSQYQNTKFTKNVGRRSRAPENFLDYITPLSDCLTQVINFEGVDFHAPPEAPVVLSRYDALFLDNITEPVVFHVEKWSLIRNASYDYSQIKNWKPKVDNSCKVRSWTCEVHIYLYPPTKANEILINDMPRLNQQRPGIPFKSHFYRYIQNVGVFHFEFYSTDFWMKGLLDDLAHNDVSMLSNFQERRRFDILVADALFDGKTEWVNGNNIFLSIFMCPTAHRELLHWKTESGRITETTVICYDCSDDKSGTYPVGEVVILEENALQIESLHQFFQQIHSDETKQLWIYQDTRSINDLLKNLELNSDIYDPQGFSPDLKIVNLRLMKYVLGNCSYKSRSVYSPDTFFEEAAYPTISYGTESPILLSHFPTHQMKLQFMACGQQIGNVPFDQLVASYDMESWCTIIFFQIIGVTLVLTSIIVIAESFVELKLHNKRERMALYWKLLDRYLMSTGRSLVTQGWCSASDSKYDQRFLSFRIIVAVSILIGMIIGEAYKGNNITKIVSPIPPVPYSRFDQLVNNSYHIYSQPAVVSLQNLSEYDVYQRLQDLATKRRSHCYQWTEKVEVENQLGNKIMKNVGVVYQSLLSNIYAALLWEEPDSEWKWRCHDSANLSQAELYVLNNTRVLDASLPYEDWKDLTDLRTAKIPNCTKLGKIAVIVLEENFLEFKKTYNLEYEMYHESPLSFGKEGMASVRMGFLWRGRVPWKALLKMKALYSSGIIGWHEHFIRKYYEFSGMLLDFPVKSRFFQAANLAGSIKILFIILPFGILPPLLAFAAEYILIHFKTANSFQQRLCGNMMASLRLCFRFKNGCFSQIPLQQTQKQAISTERIFKQRATHNKLDKIEKSESFPEKSVVKQNFKMDALEQSNEIHVKKESVQETEMDDLRNDDLRRLRMRIPSAVVQECVSTD